MNCGIDFGTSNSALAFASGQGVSIAKVEGNHTTLPSAIFYPTRGAATFGRAAMGHFMDGEEGRFMRSLKRILGTSLMGQGTIVNGRMRKFDDIIADFLLSMKRSVERNLDTEITNVVMGRPVHFADHDPAVDSRAQDELGRIAKSIGFKAVEFQYEPIAAAFAHEQKVQGEKLAFVADIGGGTSDFTVIRISRDYAAKVDRKDDILANTGVRIGGNDVDKDLSLSTFMPHLGYGSSYGEKNLIVPVTPFHEMSEWSKVNFLYTPKMKAMIRDLLYESHAPDIFGRFEKVIEEETGHRVLSVVEGAKISLTDEATVSAQMDFVEGGLQINIERPDFDQSIDGRVQTMMKGIDECLSQSGVSADDIEVIILTGGTTEVPFVKNTICAAFPNATLSDENKLSSVGLGLGYDSLRIFGAK